MTMKWKQGEAGERELTVRVGTTTGVYEKRESGHYTAIQEKKNKGETYIEYAS